MLPGSRSVLTEEVDGLRWGSLIGRVHVRIAVTAPGADPVTVEASGWRVPWLSLLGLALLLVVLGAVWVVRRRRRRRETGGRGARRRGARPGRLLTPAWSDRAASDHRHQGGGQLLRHRQLVDPAGHDLDQGFGQAVRVVDDRGQRRLGHRGQQLVACPDDGDIARHRDAGAPGPEEDDPGDVVVDRADGRVARGGELPQLIGDPLGVLVEDVVRGLLDPERGSHLRQQHRRMPCSAGARTRGTRRRCARDRRREGSAAGG